MNDELWAAITANYEEYVRRYPEEGFISLDDESETGLPLLESIRSGRGNIIEANQGSLERDCLISHDPVLPSIDSLPTPLLERLPVALTQILQVQITTDHRQYWELTYRVVKGLHRSHEFMERTLWRLIRPVFNLTLVDISKRWRRPLANRTEDTHEVELLDDSRHIAASVSYPALEGYIKARSGGVIQADGTVTEARAVRRLRTGSFYEIDDDCSSLADLLNFYETTIAGEQLRDEMASVRENIAKFGGVDADDAYGLIYRWRNTSLHGEGEADVQYGVILNLLCMLIWSEINERVEP